MLLSLFSGFVHYSVMGTVFLTHFLTHCDTPRCKNFAVLHLVTLNLIYYHWIDLMCPKFFCL